MARLLIGIVAAGLALWPSLAPRAGASCVDAALAHLPGAEVLQRETFFLPVGELHSGARRLRRPRCLTVLATATNPAASVDGVLRSDSGLELATDGPSTPHAALRFCGAAGVTLRWTLQVSAPTEVTLAVLSGVPWPLPDLGREVGACFAGAPGLRAPEPDLGPPPPTHSAQQRAESFSARQRGRGYVPERREVLALSEGRARHSIRLRAGRCYAVGAFPRIGALDLALRTERDGELAADRRRAVDASLVVCPERSGQGALILHDAGGANEAELVVLSQPAEGPPGLRGAALRAWVETRARYGPLEVEGWLHLQAGESVERPVELAGCGVAAAIRAAEAGGARFELQLLDGAGRVVASSSRPQVPVRYCARGPHRLRVRMRRGAGRVLLARTPSSPEAR